MVTLKEDIAGNPLPCNLILDGNLVTVLEKSRIKLERDWDMIGLIAGKEGSGKTTIAMQMCLAMDAGFNIDRIVFNSEGFSDAVDNAPKFSAILWDEADDLSGNWASPMIQAIKSKFKRIRKNNLFIILATPTIFDLSKYFVIGRTNFLIHVYSKNMQRGLFRYYNESKKRMLFIKGKQFWDMDVEKSLFYGSFRDYPKDFPIDLDLYDQKKEEATKEILNKSDTPKNARQHTISHLLDQGIDLEVKGFAEAFNVGIRTIQKDLVQIRANEGDVPGEERTANTIINNAPGDNFL